MGFAAGSGAREDPFRDDRSGRRTDGCYPYGGDIRAHKARQGQGCESVVAIRTYDSLHGQHIVLRRDCSGSLFSPCADVAVQLLSGRRSDIGRRCAHNRKMEDQRPLVGSRRRRRGSDMDGLQGHAALRNALLGQRGHSALRPCRHIASDPLSSHAGPGVCRLCSRRCLGDGNVIVVCKLNVNVYMKPIVSIIMGSTSDLPVLRKAADFLEQMEVPFEMNALSAHRTPHEVEEFASGAAARGLKVIIAAAGMAAALPGVIAALTPLPVIGLPIDSTLQGQDALLSIVQMPPGIPVATVGINAGLNAAILAVRMLSLSDEALAGRYASYCASLSKKIVKANADLAAISDYKYKV